MQSGVAADSVLHAAMASRVWADSMDDASNITPAAQWDLLNDIPHSIRLNLKPHQQALKRKHLTDDVPTSIRLSMEPHQHEIATAALRKHLTDDVPTSIRLSTA